MIPLSQLGASGPPLGGGGGGGGGMIRLDSLGGVGAMPKMSPPMGAPPPGMAPPAQPFPTEQQQGQQPFNPEAPPGDSETTLAEIGKSAKDYLDILQPIAIPKGGEDDNRPCPRQLACLDSTNTDLFKMFEVDMHRFDEKACKKKFHTMQALVHPDKIGREPTLVDKARHQKLKQAYTVLMDEQLRGVYRQHCFGISGSGGVAAIGHTEALSKALEMARDLRKAGEERAIVLHKASETGWSVREKDQDGRAVRGDGRKMTHQFNLFGNISSSDDDNAVMEKERRNMKPQQILEKSPKFADSFLEKASNFLKDLKISKKAAGGAFTMQDEPKVKELLAEQPKSVQKNLRKIRGCVKQMNWAMTSLLSHKESPWRGLEVKASLAETGIVKLLTIMKSGMAFGKFSEVHEEELSKAIDSVHRLYMDLFERRGQELLRSAINAEMQVVYLLPESEGRLPEGSRVILRGLQSRADLNGKGGTVTGWDYALQRYSVEVDQKEKAEKDASMVANPDLLNADDIDADEDEEEQRVELAIPKKLMLLPKNAQADLAPAKARLDNLVKEWNGWRSRPRSVSATQDAEAVAAALGPPLESMAGYLRDACSGVSTAASCPDGMDLVADECREALAGARNLAAKLLGEEPKEPPPPPSLSEPPPAIVPLAKLDPAAQALKEAAEVAAMGIKIKQPEAKKKRSRSRKRKKRSSSSSSRSKKAKKKK